MTRATGRSLELFYIDGHANGMLTAELDNWTGHVLMSPRIQLGEALKRAEPKCTGVYLLLGEQDGEPLAYIGEGDDISKRLKSHDLTKDWWTSVVFITTAGNKLNKAHVRYLEARLYAKAKQIARVPLANGAVPSVPSLSEADIAKMESFLDNLLIVLPALRVDMFIEWARKVIAPASAIKVGVSATELPSANFVLESKKHGLLAYAILQNGEFIVETGSTARLNWESKVMAHSYSSLHAELKRSGVLQIDGDHCVFTENCAFQSPSAAAAVVTGRPAAGTIEWKIKATGETYKQWETKRLLDESHESTG